MRKVGIIFLLACVFSVPAIAGDTDLNTQIDAEKLRKQLEEMQQTGILEKIVKKHHYCVTCKRDQSRNNCIVHIGGEAGRLLCGGVHVPVCGPEGGDVDYGGC